MIQYVIYVDSLFADASNRTNLKAELNKKAFKKASFVLGLLFYIQNYERNDAEL